MDILKKYIKNYIKNPNIEFSYTIENIYTNKNILFISTYYSLHEIIKELNKEYKISIGLINHKQAIIQIFINKNFLNLQQSYIYVGINYSHNDHNNKIYYIICKHTLKEINDWFEYEARTYPFYNFKNIKLYKEEDTPIHKFDINILYKKLDKILFQKRTETPQSYSIIDLIALDDYTITVNNLKLILKNYYLFSSNTPLNIPHFAENKIIIKDNYIYFKFYFNETLLYHLGIVIFEYEGSHIVSFLYHTNDTIFKELIQNYPLIYKNLQHKNKNDRLLYYLIDIIFKKYLLMDNDNFKKLLYDTEALIIGGFVLSLFNITNDNNLFICIENKYISLFMEKLHEYSIKPVKMKIMEDKFIQCIECHIKQQKKIYILILNEKININNYTFSKLYINTINNDKIDLSISKPILDDDIINDIKYDYNNFIKHINKQYDILNEKILIEILIENIINNDIFIKYASKNKIPVFELIIYFNKLFFKYTLKEYINNLKYILSNIRDDEIQKIILNILLNYNIFKINYIIQYLTNNKLLNKYYIFFNYINSLFYNELSININIIYDINILQFNNKLKSAKNICYEMIENAGDIELEKFIDENYDNLAFILPNGGVLCISKENLYNIIYNNKLKIAYYHNIDNKKIPYIKLQTHQGDYYIHYHYICSILLLSAQYFIFKLVENTIELKNFIDDKLIYNPQIIECGTYVKYKSPRNTSSL